MLKKKILWLVMLIFAAESIFSQNYSAQTWTILYKKSVSLKEKREKTKQMVDIATPEFENLIMDILREQTDITAFTGSQDKKIYEEWVSYSVTIAAKLKLKNTSPLLKKLYSRIDSPKLKGDIILSIGKIENKEDMPYLVNELNLFNTTQKAGKLAGKDEIVIGLINALDIYKDPACFDALLDSYLLSYSEKTKALSDQAMKNISSTPSTLCEKYMIDSKEYIAISGALKYSLQSGSSQADKISSAKTALMLALDIRTNANAEVVDAQKKLREEATRNLGDLKATDAEIVKLIEKKWDLDKDSMSNITTIEALQKIATDQADQMLINKLAYLTQMAKEGGGTGFTLDEGNKVTIAIIRALGEIGNKAAVDELLNAVYTLEYGKPIIDEAQKALDKINGKK
jgi:hypothetical protein